METFSEDVRHILQTAGAGWIAPAHNNNRGSHKKYNMEDGIPVASEGRRLDLSRFGDYFPTSTLVRSC